MALITAADRRAQRRQIRLIVRCERRTRAVFSRLLRQEANEIARAYARSGRRSAVSKPLVDSKRRIRKTLRPCAVALMRRFAEDVQSSVGKQLNDTFLGRIDGFLETRGLKMATSVGRDSRRTFLRIIRLGQQEGQSTDTISREMRRHLRSLASFRADRIARTEIHAAAMFADQAGARSLSIKTKKTWLANLDGRVRATHAGANGQERNEGKAFRVGGSALQYPGDPNGSTRETINCRCTMLHKRAA